MRLWRRLLVMSALVVMSALLVLHYPARAQAFFCAGYYYAAQRYSPSFGAVTTSGGDCFNSEYIGTANGVWIFWTPTTNAHIVWGAIAAHYVQDFWPYSTSALGFPTTDELDVAAAQGNRTAGKFNRFQNGWIFWNPNEGAHAAYGAIGQKYVSFGGPYGAYGWPTTDEADYIVNVLFVNINEGRIQYFDQGGYNQAPAPNYIIWYRSTGQLSSTCGSDASGTLCLWPGDPTNGGVDSLYG